jgi:hypothetical protein
VAKVADPTTPPWISPLDARKRLAKCCGGSEPYAERLILGGLAAGDVRWKAAGVHPVDHSFSQDEFWRMLEGFDWSDGTATALLGLPADFGVVSLGRVIAYGVKFWQENIDALVPPANEQAVVAAAKPEKSKHLGPQSGRVLVALRNLFPTRQIPEYFTNKDLAKQVKDELIRIERKADRKPPEAGYPSDDVVRSVRNAEFSSS